MVFGANITPPTAQLYEVLFDCVNCCFPLLTGTMLTFASRWRRKDIQREGLRLRRRQKGSEAPTEFEDHAVLF